jgi:hypothetical protein
MSDMNKEIFIFSTRYLGEECAFRNRKDLSSNQAIYSYLRDCLVNSDTLYDIMMALSLTKEALKDRFEINSITPSLGKDKVIGQIKRGFIKEETKPLFEKMRDDLLHESFNCCMMSKDLEEKIEHCVGEGFPDKLKSRFSYYCLKKEPDATAYAVPHLDWLADNGWIKALIDWSIQLDSSEDKELYLVLHDKDVPGFREEPYKYLTAEQIFNVLQNKEKTDDTVVLTDDKNHCYYSGRLVNILVFQHTDNDVVDLLNDAETSFRDIKDRLVTGNRKAMEELFSSALPHGDFDFKRFFENLQKTDYSLNPNCSVDVCNNSFIESKVLDPKQLGSNYYEYSDYNGALLTDLMHVRTTANSSRAFNDLVKCLKKPMDDSENKDLKKMRFPVIIRVYKSFFDDWANAASGSKEKILSHRNKRAMEENLDRAFSFFNNSSIWIRLVDINDKDELDNAREDFNYFESIGLYDYDSAWENLEYGLRIFCENYLKSTLDGHGNYVTPMLYGNETKYRDAILSHILKNREIVASHKPLPDFFEEKTYLNAFFDVAMRILVVDDKIAECEEFKQHKTLVNINNVERINTYRCYCERHNKNCKQCKLRTLAQILEKAVYVDRYGFKEGEFVLHDFFHWEENSIETYVCPTLTKDYIDTNSTDLSRWNERICLVEKDEEKPNNASSCILSVFEPTKSGSHNHLQIVGVRDVCTALLLMSKYKFDMVFCDYLLEYKDGNAGPRNYANQLFQFLSHDNKDEKKIEKESKERQFEILDRLRNDVLENRGPLDKLWIMPITGFNQTFIQDLYRNQIDLIGYKWNISNGADPITTPWQFLYHLNKFIKLQLKQCVYRMDKLLLFLLNTCKNIKEKLDSDTSINANFYDFQAFMGSEYASFIYRYGNRPIIKRDAICKYDDNSIDKSVFATYIWKNFYSKPENRDVIELNRLIQKFLYQASTMHNDHDGQQSLDTAFGELCNFINNNQKVKDTINAEDDLKNNQLDMQLEYFRMVMEKLTDNKRQERQEQKMRK